MIDVLGPEKRRRRTTQEKIAIVQQSFEPGMTVSLVARQHGVAASQLFLWRKQYQEGSLTAVAAGEQVVPASELAAAMKQIKELLNRPGFPGECFICELRLPDHRFRWKHNKLFLLLPEEYGPAFPAIVDCYTSPPTLVWPVPLLHGFSSSYGVLPPLCKDH